MTVHTVNTEYTLVDQGDGAFLVSGHTVYFPEPTICTMFKTPTVGESMLLTPKEGKWSGRAIITTRVRVVSNG